MFVFALLGTASAARVTLEHGEVRSTVSIRDVHGVRDDPSTPYDAVRPKSGGVDYSWEGVAIDADQNFCRHLASNLQDNKTGFERNHVDDCPADGVSCESFYIESTAGNFQLCQTNADGDCVPGRVHKCTWTFYIEDMIRKQNKSKDASCYGEILEAKRSLDGLLHSVNETYAYLMLYNQIIHEENITIRQQLMEQQSKWKIYTEAEETCMETARHQWRTRVKPLKTEIEELEAIAEPEVRSRAPLPGEYRQMLKENGWEENAQGTLVNNDRHDIGKTATPDGLLSASFVEVEKHSVKELSHTGGALSKENCESFTSLIERMATQHGVKLAWKMNDEDGYGGDGDFPVGDCHENREYLALEFDKAYRDLTTLVNERNQSLFDNRTLCLNTATYEYKYAVEGTGQIDDQIQEAAARIHRAQAEVARLEPRFHDVEHAVVRMRHYITHLQGSCAVADDVSDHLKKIARLIEEMQECPGRNDFTLTVPHWHHPNPETPSPTPWTDRTPV
jgi:hypothetical protein